VKKVENEDLLHDVYVISKIGGEWSLKNVCMHIGINGGDK